MGGRFGAESPFGFGMFCLPFSSNKTILRKAIFKSIAPDLSGELPTIFS
jgi:hypothetical protein